MTPMTRREMLRRAGAGFGMLGLAGILGRARAEAPARAARTHLPARAKRVIFLFMNGGPSHVDTFDPKPALKAREGDKPEGNAGRTAKAGYLPSPFAFGPHGQSG